MVKWGKIIFGGVDSSEYGIYITGEAVYNAPERDVEFVEIPGRNGALALDKGRFKNITVTYPAGAFGKSQEEFREALSEFRNAIMSQTGYQKLKDSYHPDEYRMGIYAAGLEVSPVAYGQAAEFELTFECKPQRWLKIGEYPVPIDSGDILENPTPFDSSPLLELEGYGNILLNDDTINIDIPNVPLGVVNLPLSGESYVETDQDEYTFNLTFDDSILNDGDKVWFATTNNDPFTINFTLFGDPALVGDEKPTSLTVTSSGEVLSHYVTLNTDRTPFEINVTLSLKAQYNFTVGVNNQNIAPSISISFDVGEDTYTIPVGVQIFYYGADELNVTPYAWLLTEGIPIERFSYKLGNLNGFYGNSSQTVSGSIVVDCELGEAYKIFNGSWINLNSAVSFGNDLPVLPPGTNKVVYSNTFTRVDITPRWWKV